MMLRKCYLWGLRNCLIYTRRHTLRGITFKSIPKSAATFRIITELILQNVRPIYVDNVFESYLRSLAISECAIAPQLAGLSERGMASRSAALYYGIVPTCTKTSLSSGSVDAPPQRAAIGQPPKRLGLYQTRPFTVRNLDRWTQLIHAIIP